MTSVSKNSFYVGVDLGQSQDYTAIVILEHLQRDGPADEHRDDKRRHVWHVRHCERLPLGTSYHEVTKHIKALLTQLEEAGGRVTLIVDATGVGRPVIDSLKEHGLRPVAITVTSGLDVSAVGNGEFHVPKRDLVSAAKVMLGNGQLKVAKGVPCTDDLIRELDNYRVKISITGRDSYEAWREGDKDDLVFALCLCCWWALQKRDFVSITDVARDTSEAVINTDRYYRVGWVPAHSSEHGALAVFNFDFCSVVSFRRLKNETMRRQIERVFLKAQSYDAAVWSEAGVDDSILNALSQRGAYVQRVEPDKLAQAYENLKLLISLKAITLPSDPGLLADIEAGHNSSITALCLVTYDVLPEEPRLVSRDWSSKGNYYFVAEDFRWYPRW